MHTGAIVVFTCALLLVVGGGFDSVEAQSPPAEGAVLVPIGKVVTSTGAVTIEHGGGAVVLQANINGAVQTKVGDPVYKGDVVSTGGDGEHFYFAAPTDVSLKSGVLAEGLDVKADGGYVIAPPSLHPSGRRYRWDVGR